MHKIQGGLEERHNAKDRFILRFHDEGQRAAIKARAATNNRSMNAEVLVLIERGVRASEKPGIDRAQYGGASVTVDLLFAAAFSVLRDPRSTEYQAGVRAALAFRIDGQPIRREHAAGTAAEDAFHAGAAEGHAIWRQACSESASAA